MNQGVNQEIFSDFFGRPGRPWIVRFSSDFPSISHVRAPSRSALSLSDLIRARIRCWLNPVFFAAAATLSGGNFGMTLTHQEFRVETPAFRPAFPLTNEQNAPIVSA
jgi:hypothetical protein